MKNASITDKIKETLGDIQFFYGAEALANHVRDVLKEEGLINENESPNGKIEFVDTSNSDFKRKRFWNIMK